MRLIEKSRSQVPEVVWYCGSTGTGKSKHMRRMINEEDLYIWHPQQECWFHGYDRHVACLFEEFRGQLSWSFVLSLTDNYDCRVQHKGGCSQFVATRIYFTFPLYRGEWFPDLAGKDRFDQLERRVTRLVNMDELFAAPKAKRMCLMHEHPAEHPSGVEECDTALLPLMEDVNVLLEDAVPFSSPPHPAETVCILDDFPSASR